MQFNRPANTTRLTGTTAETVVNPGRCAILAIVPDSTTTGTVTVRDSATAVGSAPDSVSAIGLTQQGKQFGPYGVICDAGLTVQLSAAGDAVMVIWVPIL